MRSCILARVCGVFLAAVRGGADPTRTATQRHFKVVFHPTETVINIAAWRSARPIKWKSTMKRKPKRGIELICPKHGAAAMLVQGCSPTDKHSFEVTCKGGGGRRKCSHHEYASDKQVEGIIRAHPGCNAREYQVSAWDILFERPTKPT